MTPPISNSCCPKEFQGENALPFDECSCEDQSSIPPNRRHAVFSLNVDPVIFPLAGGENKHFLSGLGLLWMPHRNWGLGLQANTNYQSELGAHARMEWRFNLDRNGAHQGFLTLLPGLKYVWDQKVTLADTGAVTRAKGTRFNGGLEFGWMTHVARWMAFSTYFNFNYTPPSELTLLQNPGGEEKAKGNVQLQLGLRIPFQFGRTGP